MLFFHPEGQYALITGKRCKDSLNSMVQRQHFPVPENSGSMHCAACSLFDSPPAIARSQTTMPPAQRQHFAGNNACDTILMNIYLLPDYTTFPATAPIHQQKGEIRSSEFRLFYYRVERTLSFRQILLHISTFSSINNYILLINNYSTTLSFSQFRD